MQRGNSPFLRGKSPFLMGKSTSKLTVCYWKLLCLMGKSTISTGPFSIAFSMFTREHIPIQSNRHVPSMDSCRSPTNICFLMDNLDQFCVIWPYLTRKNTEVLMANSQEIIYSWWMFSTCHCVFSGQSPSNMMIFRGIDSLVCWEEEICCFPHGDSTVHKWHEMTWKDTDGVMTQWQALCFAITSMVVLFSGCSSLP